MGKFNSDQKTTHDQGVSQDLGSGRPKQFCGSGHIFFKNGGFKLFDTSVKNSTYFRREKV